MGQRFLHFRPILMRPVSLEKVLTEDLFFNADHSFSIYENNMEIWRMFIFMYLALLQTICCQEISFSEPRCNIEYQCSCASRVAATFDDKVLEERKEFTLAYKSQTEETLVACDWISGQFSCNPANGFKCDNQPRKNFSCNIDIKKCFNSGEFSFDVENMDAIWCKIYPNESNIDKMVTSTSNPNCDHQNKERTEAFSLSPSAKPEDESSIGMMVTSTSSPNGEHQNEEKQSLDIKIGLCGGLLAGIGIAIIVLVIKKCQVCGKQSSQQEMSIEATTPKRNGPVLNQNISPLTSETALSAHFKNKPHFQLGQDINNADYEENRGSRSIYLGLEDEDDTDLPLIGVTVDANTKA